MLTGVHFLLTYTCNFECDHCFLYCSPWSQGTFTISQVTDVLEESKKIGITIAQEFLSNIKQMDRVKGIYLMPPFIISEADLVELTQAVVSVVRDSTGQAG